MRRSLSFFLVMVLALSSFLTGCTNKSVLSAKNPVTVTMWHNFGGEMQTMMDSLIDEFNSTIGKEKGIIVNVTAISSSSELQENLNMIINGDPGTPELPDLFTSYPKTAIHFANKGMLCNLYNYFTEEELSEYVPQFLDEGRIYDNGLYVFPFAKSTEILYLNQTLFDRFSAETGITMDCFKSFEGISDAASKYYKWTDDKTPEIKNDGKQFFAADSWLNFAQVGMKQKGASLFKNEKLNLDNDIYKSIWETCYNPSVGGGFALYDGYSSDLSKTGDLVCSTGSSAGILFYGDTITYSDNRTENVTYNILPYPVFDGGEKIALQRGNGFCVSKSNEQKELAACTFLKWFTEEQQNMRFIEFTGYLPVTNNAFKNGVPERIKTVEDKRVKKMLIAASEMYNTYDFFIPPVFDDFDSIGKKYENDYKQNLKADREVFVSSDTDLKNLSEKSLKTFINYYKSGEKERSKSNF